MTTGTAVSDIPIQGLRRSTAMNVLTPQPTELPAPPSANPPAHRRPSRSNSLSSSVRTVRRSTSLKDTAPDPSSTPHRRATPPPSRRRSSAAADLRDGVANLHRWSQSTTSPSPSSTAASKSPAKPPSEKRGHRKHPSVSRHQPALSAHPPPNGSQVPSPTRNHAARSPSSPASSPQRRPRPRSPAYYSPAQPADPPRLPSLPLLPATVYDPRGSNNSDLFTPTTYTPSESPDYFASKHRPSSRTRPDRPLGRSPLGSPPIGVLESEARHAAASTGPRPPAAKRSAAGGSKDLSHRPPQSAVHERSFSKELDPRDRSESTASSRLDDAYQGTPPRVRERREKDKKTMLSRALQKANTAVLLDNAQNFEGAMEAYGDACKLLQQVMIRSSGEEDRRKLDSIVSACPAPASTVLTLASV